MVLPGIRGIGAFVRQMLLLNLQLLGYRNHLALLHSLIVNIKSLFTSQNDGTKLYPGIDNSWKEDILSSTLILVDEKEVTLRGLATFLKLNGFQSKACSRERETMHAKGIIVLKTMTTVNAQLCRICIKKKLMQPAHHSFIYERFISCVWFHYA